MAVRDAEKIKATLNEVGGKVIATKGCTVLFPVRYEVVGLATIGSDTSFCGVAKITSLDGSYYAIHSCLAMLHSSPDEIKTVTIDDVPYYELRYDPGSVLIEDINLLQDNSVISKVYAEFIGKGKVPSYLTYADLCDLFSTAREFAGASIGDTYEILAVPISIIARNPDDINQYYREIINDIDMDTVKPIYVPAGSVNYSASSTITKITGSYFYPGLVSAVNQPTERADNLDHVLRY